MEELFGLLVAFLFLAFLAGILFLGSAGVKGRIGELKVRAVTSLRLDAETYRSLHGLIVPTPDGTTQIDHVIVSKFGVFVIETKNLKGWIFGSPDSRRWTQTIYGRKYRHQNPLRQNYKHVEAIRSLLSLDARCFHSVVVFVGKSTFKTDMPSNVVVRRRLVSHIKSKSEILLSDQQVDDSVRVLSGAEFSGRRAERRHVKNLRKNRRKPICPKCGSAMVVRVARRGRRTGGKFWGCSRFPQCRATKIVV